MKNIGIGSVMALGLLLGLPQAHAQTYTRTDTITYEDNLSLWVIGQPKTSTNINTGLVESKTDYDPVTALPIRTYAFGKLQQTLTYDATSLVSTGQRGTLKTASDGRDGTTNTTVTFSSWKRGIPQLIQFPATPEAPSGSSKSAVVNNNGWIDSVTDENSSKTCYGFDAMGRLTSITYPSEIQAGICNTTKWAATTRTFVPIAAAEYGIAAGHWKQTVSTGNGRQVTYYDAMWRPLVSERYDTANIAGTLSQTVTRYDADGHAVYQSYPMQGLTEYTVSTQGIRTTYDALDRVTRVEQDSELGVLATTTVYQAGLITKVTNPRLKVTTTSYKAYDQPSTDWPLAIAHPEGAYTDITRDVFGKPTSLKRRNSTGSLALTRTYAYFPDTQELCKTTEPETGATLMGYDTAGNLAWSASGLPTATACDKEGDTATILARRTVRAYDARNRVEALTFPDNLGNTDHTYTADGLPASIAANNGGSAIVTTTYGYNKRRLPVSERMQWGSVDLSLGYGYNPNGHLASQTFPGSLTVAYAPNALGQATQAGTYATGVSYFPNGAIKQFTYGNGIVHTLLQNTRQLPDRSKDVYSTSPAVLDNSYDYDANGNVAAISDGLVGNRGNRTMTYDGLDRLTATTSPMFGTGGAVYAYDVLDNLTRAKMGVTPLAAARDHYFCYDANWHLTFVRNGPACTGTASPAVDTLEYDAQGNVKSKDAQTFTFDFGNRLRSVNAPASSYVYDGHGRRVRDQTTASKYSLYNQSGQLAFASDGRQAKYFNYIYLAGSLVATREWAHSGGTIVAKYQHTDALGSPIAVTDATRAVERSEYEPYGKLLNRPIHDGPGYTGHVEDAATGLTYMQQRYYDPGIGRFLSVDPVTADGNSGGNFNRYWYANNNPYRFTDPDGRMPMGQGGSHPTEDRMEYLRRMEEAKRDQENRAKEDARRQRIASIRTYMRSGRTVLTRGGLTTQWPSRNAVSRRSLPGAGGPYSSKDVYPAEGPYKGESHANEYGPNDILKTNDGRGRWLHGGGTGLADPLAPQQGWKPTLGCTRMQNEDIQELVDMVREFKTAYPEQKISYERVNQ